MSETARPYSAGREMYYRDASHDQPGSRSEAGSTAEQAKSTAKQLKQQAADKAASFAQRARESTESSLRQRKSDIVERLSGLAASIREAGHTLEERKTGMNAEYADAAADQVDRLAEYLREHDVQEMWDAVEAQVRRRPALFLGGAFVIGLATARFLHSSAQRRREQEQERASESWQAEGSEPMRSEAARAAGIYHPPGGPSGEPYTGPSTPPSSSIPPNC